MTLKEILEQGLSGVLAIGIVALWLRLNTVTDRLIGRLENMDDERQVMQEELGITDTHVRRKTAVMRERRRQRLNEHKSE